MGMTVITWADSQMVTEKKNHRQHCKLINGERGLEEYGSCAYLVDEDWWDSVKDKENEDIPEDYDDDDELEIAYDDELEELGFLDPIEDEDDEPEE